MRKVAVKRILAAALFAAMMVGMFAGCSNKDTNTSSSKSAPTLNPDGSLQYPINTEEPVTLTYWREIEMGLSKYISNNADTEFAKELEKRTGVKIEFIHPPSGEDNIRQSFNVMIASRDLPDIIEYNINNLYPGGPEKAISDGVVIPLDELAETYAPDYLKYLETVPEVKKYCVTNSGNLVMYPSTLLEQDVFQAGPMIRGDLLEELGLSVPETIDEWYTVLKAIKESGKVEYPLSWSEKGPKLKSSGEFTGAFGVLLGLWQMDENGKVQYGASLPQYKDFLTEFHKWFEEGLIDVEFAVQDRNTLRAKVADGKVAAYRESASSMVEINRNWRAKDPNTKKVIIGAPHATLHKGDKATFGSKSLPIVLNNCAVITTACKNPEVAAQWLNYGYTDEGAKLYNYGVEGKSYNMVDGKAIAADWIITPPESISKEQVPLNWYRQNGPFKKMQSFVPDELHDVQEYIEARRDVWTNVSNELKMPEVAPPPEKADRYATLYSEIDTYVDEMFVKFIMGQEPLENFDQYVERLYKLGLQECIDIQQEVLDGWNNR